MPIFIVKNNPGFKNPIVLSKEDEHHLVHVVRAKAGQALTLTDNQGTRATVQMICDFTCRGTKSCAPTFKILEKTTQPKPFPLTVCLPLIDQTRLEWAIEKLCELNVQTVQLISTERCQFKTLSANKMERLHKIAEAAQKQCERAWPMEILDVVALKKMRIDENVLNFFGFLPVGATGRSPLQRTTDDERRTTLFIGPEGGFTPTEISFFEQHKVQPISIGQTVLRTETAAVVLATVIVNR